VSDTTGLAEFRPRGSSCWTHADDYEAAYAGFRWPVLDEFNWALEWFDHLGAAPDSADQPRPVDRRAGRLAAPLDPTPSCPPAPTRWPTGCARTGDPGRPDRADAGQTRSSCGR